jgi:alkanesulfonate monooxygenase SsuD/methylene tetrahydromethanopterin reductase-like flavin-dependent oxidoreductase (luciferase family)
VALRDPVIAAKTIATLDWQSEGRLELGVGYGWNAEEMATHGVSVEDAPARLEDTLDLMKALWTNDEGSHSGPFVSVESSWSWPKPVQVGGPTIHLGARASKQGFDDIARWGSGWLPIEGYGTVIDHIPDLHRAFERAGRDPATAIVSVYSSSGDPATLEQYAAAGVDRVLCALPPEEESVVMAALEDITLRLAEYLI